MIMMHGKLPDNPSLTDPASILRYREQNHAAELLAACLLHLDLFTWLEDQQGATTIEILSRFGLKTRPADVMLTLFRANGFIITNSNGVHHLTTMGREYLVKSSPWFLGPYYEALKETPVTQDFLEILRTNSPSSWKSYDEQEDWHNAMKSREFAESFTSLMHARGISLGQALANRIGPYLGDRKTLLDVAGGSGIYAATLVNQFPYLNATVMEQSPVVEIAEKHLKDCAPELKIDVIEADLFNPPWPGSYEIILLSNVLHDWDIKEVKTIMQNTYEMMEKHALLVIHEAFLKDDKSGPLEVAEYSCLLMHITQGKCYTPGEYEEMLTEIGFSVGPCIDTIGYRGFMVAEKL